MMIIEQEPMAAQTGRQLARDVQNGDVMALLPYVSPARFVSKVSERYDAQIAVLERLHSVWQADVIRYYAREMISESLNQF